LALYIYIYNLTCSSNYILLKTVYICIVKIKSKKERDKENDGRYFDISDIIISIWYFNEKINKLIFADKIRKC